MAKLHQMQRLREAYARINVNPLGAAALATSSFPLDRKRLAVLATTAVAPMIPVVLAGAYLDGGVV